MGDTDECKGGSDICDPGTNNPDVCDPPNSEDKCLTSVGDTDECKGGSDICDPGTNNPDVCDPPNSEDKCLTSVGDTDEANVIQLISFTANADVNGSVVITWKTATEIDNAGFNLYRARSKDGHYKKINDFLIPAQGNATSGASYSHVDTPPAKGTYYYKLEDVDYNGLSTMHGPEKVRVRK
ncbi:MAG: hypothetical protein E3K36_09375 [Candidatus Brocadia sp.]|nr:hypothetical protein [Candidatus Brocadia sp.]